MEPRSLKAYVAEFLGTFVLVFAITLAVTLFISAQGTGSDWAVVGLVHAFVLFMLVASLGVISGGHFNPAVTIAATFLRKINPADGALYVFAQLLGGMAGAFVTKLVISDPVGKTVNFGAVGLNKGLLGGSGDWTGLIVEALGTFFLVWAVVALAMSPKTPKEWAPLVIGVTLGFGVMIAGPLTGGALNPARWFGAAVAGDQWSNWWVYLVGDIAGGLLGGLTYWYLFVEDKPAAGSGVPGGGGMSG